MRTLLLICTLLIVPSHSLMAQLRPLPTKADLPKLREASQKGDVVSMYQLGVCYIEEIGVEMDYLEAKDLLEKAAAKGDAPSMTTLAQLYLGVPGISRDNEKAFAWAQKAFATGHPSGQLAIAYFHLNGIGTPKSEEQAVRMLRKAMNSEPDAMVQLGKLQLGASATLKNEKEGFQLISIAASKGNRNAQAMLGYCYASGKGTRQDLQNARLFAQNAQRMGSIEGANLLAQLALEESTPETEKIMELLAKGVRHQNATSCYIMGMIYLRGIGITQSYYDACRLLRLSAEKGDSYGLLGYANICFNGRGRSSDEVLGLACMIASSMMGNDDAQRYLDNIKGSDKQGSTYLKAALVAQSIVRQTEQGESPAELQENWHSALFDSKGQRTPTPSGSRTVMTGSGLIFTKQGHCFTNHHVVDGARALKVRVPGVKEPLPATLVGADETNDLAVLKIEGWSAGDEALPPIVSCAKVRSGDKAFTVGYPMPSLLGQEAKFTSGDISSLTGMDEDRRLMQISAPIQPGNSGGPLVLEDGRVIGVVVSTLNAAYTLRKRGTLPQNVNFAVKSDYMLALAASCDIELPAPSKPSADPIGRIKAHSVQVIAER